MPFKWDNESERGLLLLVISEMTAPSTGIWPIVAERLGGGLNGNACRYHRMILLCLLTLALLLLSSLPCL